MKRVIVFGDLPIATKIVEYLNGLNYIELIGVVTWPRKKRSIDAFNCDSLYEYAINNHIRIYSLEELANKFSINTLDFGLVVRFSKILKRDVISLFRKHILNFHGGLLPEYSGLYSSCHEILQMNEFGGGTLHFIKDERLDSGDIVKRCEFKILPTDTSESVFIKTQKVLYEGFCSVADDFFHERIISIPQSQYINAGYKFQHFYKKDLEKELQLDDSIKKAISVHARGFEFTDKERGYIIYNGQKIYFTTKNLEGVV